MSILSNAAASRLSTALLKLDARRCMLAPAPDCSALCVRQRGTASSGECFPELPRSSAAPPAPLRIFSVGLEFLPLLEPETAGISADILGFRRCWLMGPSYVVIIGGTARRIGGGAYAAEADKFPCSAVLRQKVLRSLATHVADGLQQHGRASSSNVGRGADASRRSAARSA